MARTASPAGIYVQSFPDAGFRKQIADSGRYPIWRKDGQEIVYYDQNRIWSVRVEAAGANLRFSAPEPLFSVRPPVGLVVGQNPLEVSRDGSHIYFPQAAEQPDSDLIHVKMGWLGAR